MMNLCARARFTQKARTGSGIVLYLPVDNLDCNQAIQDGVERSVGYGHGACAEFDRETVGTYVNFEVSQPKRTREQSTQLKRRRGQIAPAPAPF